MAPGDNQMVTLLEGKALEPKEPRVVSISGVLNSPLEWLIQRVDQIDQKKAHILVDRDKMTIKLVVEESDHYATTISGALQLHPMIGIFNINTGKALSNFDMAKLFKMNRSAFEVQSEAMALVDTLQNFRAKVDRDIEKANDNRGNKRDLLNQAVESNLPDAFYLHIPVFKGTEKQRIEVEVYINPDDFSCQLISAQANDIIAELRDSEIDKVINGIVGVAEGIVIIEV